jgi:hypothetical protein
MAVALTGTLEMRPFGPQAAQTWAADGCFNALVTGAGDASGGAFTITISEPSDVNVAVRSLKLLAANILAASAALEGTQALIKATGKAFLAGLDQVIVQGWLMSGSLGALTFMGGDRGGVGGEPTAFYPFSALYEHNRDGWFHPLGGGLPGQPLSFGFETTNGATLTGVNFAVFGLYRLWAPYR